MLRDPVARLLSAYSFILRRPLNPMHRKLKRGRVGPLVDRCFLNAPTARAVRNRRALFAKELIKTGQAKAEAVPVTSLACGPAQGYLMSFYRRLRPGTRNDFEIPILLGAILFWTVALPLALLFLSYCRCASRRVVHASGFCHQSLSN
jgi:hypothetical protein